MGIGHFCRFSNLSFISRYKFGFTQKDLHVKKELGGRYTFFTGRKPRPSPDRHFN